MSKIPNAQNEWPLQEFNRVWKSEKDFKLLKKAQDPRFGEIQIWKNSVNNEVLFSKETQSSSKDEA